MIKQAQTVERYGLDHKTYSLLKSLNTPAKIQNYLNSLPFNFEKGGETNSSVEETLKRGSAHCLEGALVAAAALMLQGRAPLLLDLKATKPDFDHVVAIFREGKYYGAISKTNHAVLRYREPIYRDVRELAMSYFHEYFLDNGKKTLRSFSEPFDLTQTSSSPSPRSRRGLGEDVWLTSKENLAWLAHTLDKSPHTDILSKKQIKTLRKADDVEIRAGKIVEYK